MRVDDCKTNLLFLVALRQARAAHRLTVLIEDWRLMSPWYGEMSESVAKARAAQIAAVELVVELEDFLRRNMRNGEL